MCRYRYYYFGTCQHHETILFDFCANALPLQDDEYCTSAPPSTGNKGKAEEARGSFEAAETEEEEVQEGASAQDNTDLPSLSSTKFTSPSSSINSSFVTGSAYITAEPCVDCSPLLADHSSLSSTRSASSPNMAGLPLFGSAFRRWMDSGTTGAAEQATHPAKYCMSDQSSMNMVRFICVIPVMCAGS